MESTFMRTTGYCDVAGLKILEEFLLPEHYVIKSTYLLGSLVLIHVDSNSCIRVSPDTFGTGEVGFVQPETGVSLLINLRSRD